MQKRVWPKWYLLTAIWISAWSCGETAHEDLLTNEDDDSVTLTQPLTKGTMGANQGDKDYCNNPAFQCVAGEGDCDADSQCTTGNFFSKDVGPQFGMPAKWDVCIPTHCKDDILSGDETGVDCGGAFCKPCINTNPLPAGHPDYCNNANFLCLAGEGDCDADSQCTAGNFCGQNNGPQFGMPSGYDVCIPTHCKDGILSGDETGVDCGGALCAPCNNINPLSLGDANYCNNANFPCLAGEGDCDADSQCTAGNFCGQNNGPQFGMPSGYDVCIPTHCKDGILSGDETGVDCGGAFCKPCINTNPLPAGHPDYCDTPNSPCQVGQGDCDSDTQCDAGLSCKSGLGEYYGFTPTTDVCVVSHCANNILDSAQGELAVDCGGADCVPCGELIWQKRLGGNGSDFTRKMAADNNGDLYIIGDFSGTTNLGGANLTSGGQLDIFVAKYSGSSGEHLWSLRIGSTENETPYDIKIDSTNNIYLTGTFNSNTLTIGPTTLTKNLNANIFLTKISSEGLPQWAKSFSSSSSILKGNALSVNANGDLYMVGEFGGSVNFDTDPNSSLTSSINSQNAFLVKFNSIDGSHIWSKAFKGVSIGLNFLDITLSSTSQPTVIGNVFTGSVNSPANLGGADLLSMGAGRDIIMAQFSTVDGSHIWSVRYGALNHNVIPTSMAMDPNDNIFLGGLFFGTSNLGGSNLVSKGSTDAFIAKYNANGEHLSSLSYGGLTADNIQNLSIQGENIYLTGAFGSTVNFGNGALNSAGSTDIFLLKLNSNLNTINSSSYGMTSSDEGRSVVTTPRAVFWGGSFQNTVDFGVGQIVSAGGSDIFIIKTIL